MKVTIGLTGGIASGKSTVSSMLRELEFPIIDADVIAREVVEVGEEAYHSIVDAFGDEIIRQDGSIDRAKLGAIVFNSEEMRKTLNSIVHPAVRKRMIELKETYLSENNAVVLDIPLLFESQLTYMVDKTLLVYVDPDTQLQRLMNRNQLSKEEALARIHSQLPLADKINRSDEVINNNGTIKETKEQLLQVLTKWELV
ncbi:dephospho-CoA kinase [Bacillus suaedaesalsae]|uniref:Dephospho-CoA kinase n=1 Tax=Bacillus suaedaesalsae TaxID=2810349 RepID=A0ABS2DGE4_9BACI|nr:dephospho-CoA kinase [Bacillus suaedaesalsae]MBM6617502.1 dephospho-CoA kinase [Bacillus suaedaesalsae]